jgi:nucleobase:cation symporter-1, NCS1 family
LASASIFITFLASYQIFLAAISGIIICDYYLLRRGNLVIPDLYTANSGSTYRFFHGWNPNAFVIYVIAVAPSFYGFLHSLGVAAPLGVIRFYYFAYPFTISVAFGGFYLLSRYLPNSGYHPMKTGWQEPKDYLGERDADGSTLEAASSLNNDNNGAKDGRGLSHVSAVV